MKYSSENITTLKREKIENWNVRVLYIKSGITHYPRYTVNHVRLIWTETSVEKTFHKVGAWICILDTCIIIFLVQYSWFRLFCYGYFVIGYLFAFCCIAELICNKMRSSGINLYYSEMQLELSEIDLNDLKFIWKLLKLTWIIWNSLGNFWNWPEKGVVNSNVHHNTTKVWYGKESIAMKLDV